MIKQESELSMKTCVPCSETVPPLRGESIQRLHSQLGNEWTVIDEHHLEKEFTFPDFKKTLHFAVRIGELAEREGHHPNMEIEFGKVTMKIWTHTIRGLSENDFILAAKTDQAYEEWQNAKI